VTKTVQAAVPVVHIELADAVQMDAINKYSKLDLPVAPVLWMEFHGTENSVTEQVKIVQMIASEHGGTLFTWATNPEERRKLWQARHDAYFASNAACPGTECWVTDICVLNQRFVHRALSLDGTCTGEHGVGCGKLDFLIAEHDEAMDVMRAIKKAIDPDNIMNPGKILRI
jgi:D-lactate dehydrogenase (cytochrome)